MIYLEKYGIYLAKTIGDIMGYIWQNYGIYLLRLLVYSEKLWDIMGKN